MKKVILPIAVFAAITLSLNSCKKEDSTPSYDVPSTYDFDSVNYTGQTQRLAMITELVAEVKKANTIGTSVDAQLLKNMYTNTGSPFANAELNAATSKQLKNKVFATEQAVLETVFDEIGTLSASGATASNGTAGIIDGISRDLLVDANGIEYKERVEKTLQGALIYYQIVGHYLSEDQIGPHLALADRQHHWDEAFGYYGVPRDYTTTTTPTGLAHIGKYANDRNALLGNATAAVKAFIKGRAALNNKDEATVTAQVAIIRENIEKGVAGTAVHYINEALANVNDAGTFHHTMSEGYFLIKSLKYNPAKKITDAQIAELEILYGSNFYNATTTDLIAAKNLLSTIYGFESVKDVL